MKKISMVLLLLLAACGKEKKDENVPFEFSQLNWVVGEWKIEKPNGTMFEVWRKENDSTLTGKSFRVTADDTLMLEQMTIEQRHHEISFVALVEGNRGAVPFKLKRHGDREIMFENPEHDFPQRIFYARRSDDSLYARIEGTEHGEDKSGEYRFVRSK